MKHHLLQLELPHGNPGSSPLEVDILIETQVHWNFIGAHQVREHSGQVAIRIY